MKAPDEMVHAYMQCAMFEAIHDGQLPSGEFDGDPNDLAHGLWIRGREACDEFVGKMRPCCVEACEDDDRWEECGRDFWYTREGHGCGFWDGDWPLHGDALTEIAEEIGGDDYFGVDVTDHFLTACERCDDC